MTDLDPTMIWSHRGDPVRATGPVWAVIARCLDGSAARPGWVQAILDHGEPAWTAGLRLVVADHGSQATTWVDVHDSQLPPVELSGLDRLYQAAGTTSRAISSVGYLAANLVGCAGVSADGQAAVEAQEIAIARDGVQAVFGRWVASGADLAAWWPIIGRWIEDIGHQVFRARRPAGMMPRLVRGRQMDPGRADILFHASLHKLRASLDPADNTR